MAEYLVAEGANLGQNPPQPCTILSVGQTFFGSQKVMEQGGDLWKIKVCIQGSDFEQGYLCGTMECTKSPNETVETFWEGEIIDGKNYTFLTRKWGATLHDDVGHWEKFFAFQSLMNQSRANGNATLDLSNFPFIFMRWKEKNFVNGEQDCGLNISGLYYLSFSLFNGSIMGFYYDPNDPNSFPYYHPFHQIFHISPFQHIQLNHITRNQGFSFSSYELR